MWGLSLQMQKGLEVGQSPCNPVLSVPPMSRKFCWTSRSLTHACMCAYTQINSQAYIGMTEPFGYLSHNMRESPSSWHISSQRHISRVEINKPRLSGGGASSQKLTFCFGTNETGSGAVEEVQDPSYSHADICVARVEVQGCESLELELDKLLWGHFEMRDLERGAKINSREDPE